MENKFLNGLKEANNFTYTENGAVTHVSTLSKVLDMFALGGSYRNRTEEDCITLFKSALAEDEALALKCLFYLADVRGGQGERRFFKVCYKWLAENYEEIALRNMKYIPEYTRWDNLYCLIGTSLENEMFEFMKEQLAKDLVSYDSNPKASVSLLAKWLKSCNASSKETRKLGKKTAKAFGMTEKQYRKTLAALRERSRVVERLLSQNRIDEIEYDKIPSKAGLIYRNVFAKKDYERYNKFINSKETKVNAGVLNPVDIATQIYDASYRVTDNDRVVWQKYWDNLKDYYNGREENGIAIVDTSGSMYGRPLAAAVSMGAYIAERGHGPFANHFITFSSNPDLVEFEGVDIYAKFTKARSADWGGSTNIEATFDMMLDVIRDKNIPADEIPARLYIFSDMEFNACVTSNQKSTNRWGYNYYVYMSNSNKMNTLLESIAEKWKSYGYELPQVIFWNLDARQDNIPALNGRFAYVSGNSMSTIEAILSGKDGYDLMLEVLQKERYEVIK